MDGPRDATTTGTGVSEGDSVIPDLESTQRGLKSKKRHGKKGGPPVNGHRLGTTKV